VSTGGTEGPDADASGEPRPARESGRFRVAGTWLRSLGLLLGAVAAVLIVQVSGAPAASAAPDWVHQLGTAGDDSASGVAVDGDGNVYVTGVTEGTLPGSSETGAGSNDVFVASYRSDGTTRWVHQLGTVGNDEGSGVAVDGDGNVYVVGYTYGALPGSSETGAGQADVFVAGYASDGTKRWVHQLGTAGNDEGSGVAVDGDGNVYVVGYTYGALPGSSETGAGQADVFVAGYASDGTKRWVHQLGSSSWDSGWGVGVDKAGNVYVTGESYGTLPGSSDAGAGGDDVFVASYAGDGTLRWVRQLGAAEDDAGKGLGVDRAGNVYVTGETRGTLPGSVEANAGDADVLVASYASDGTPRWVHQLGSADRDFGQGVGVDRAGNISVIGGTDATLAGSSEPSAGQRDMFVVRNVGESTVTYPSRFVGLSPKRLLDTRDGTGAAAGRVGPASSVAFTVRGGATSVPDDASAVVLNVTGVAPSVTTFVTAYPHGSDRPLASNLNLGRWEVAANLVTVQVGVNGQVDLYNTQGAVDLVADVVGYYGDDDAAAGFRPLTPKRLLDTRNGSGAPRAKVGAGGSVDVEVAGGSTSVPADAVAVVLNVTGVAPSVGTYVTVWPTGEARPLASNLNLAPGQVRPNLVIAEVGSGGKVSIYNAAGRTDLLADVMGYFTTTDAGAYEFVATSPYRLYDSRESSPVLADQVLQVEVGGVGPVPADAAAVVVNTTITQPTSGSYFTEFPSDVPLPLASNLNFGPRQTVPNLVMTGLGGTGRISGYNAVGSTHVVYDISGYFVDPL